MIFGNFCQENKNYNKNIKIEYNKIHDNFFLQYLFTFFFFFLQYFFYLPQLVLSKELEFETRDCDYLRRGGEHQCKRAFSDWLP